jgi:hypothetical protein
MDYQIDYQLVFMGLGLFFSPAVVLAILFPLAIQYQNGWRWVMPITLIAAILDVIANFSCLALVTLDWPRSGEMTFSQRLHRLQYDTGWRGSLARFVVACLNWVQPNHVGP